jgi:hypothetical protein
MEAETMKRKACFTENLTSRHSFHFPPHLLSFPPYLVGSVPEANARVRHEELRAARVRTAAREAYLNIHDKTRETHRWVDANGANVEVEEKRKKKNEMKRGQSIFLGYSTSFQFSHSFVSLVTVSLF